ncbi:MAG: hypothetical protein QGD89_03895 [Actinomycetota bacterium]|nr:hypothetical protein [Actinomycetota bacterium]
MEENPIFETTEASTGLQADLGQMLRYLLVCTKRLGVSAEAVTGSHQVLPEVLPKGVLNDQALEIGENVGGTAQPEEGLGPDLDELQMEFLEFGDSWLGEVIVHQFAERPTPPQMEGIFCSG